MVLAMRVGQEPDVISTTGKTCFQLGWRPFFSEITWIWTEKRAQVWWKPFLFFLVFILENTYVWTEKPTQSEWGQIKIWVKIFWCCFLPPKTPIQIPGYAPVGYGRMTINFLRGRHISICNSISSINRVLAIYQMRQQKTQNSISIA